MKQSNKFAGVHLVGSIAMDNCEQVFRDVSASLGPYLQNIPDGETGERSRWIYFQRSMLLEHPAMEIDSTEPELSIYQWDGKLLRSLPLLRFREDANLDEVEFQTGYDQAADYSYGIFKRLREEGAIPAGVRFQVCLPTPMASCYMYISPKSYDDYLRVYQKSLLKALNRILELIPHKDLCIQYDVCQEVLLFEDYFPYRPPDYQEQIFTELAALGDAVPEEVTLGYHLCYGTPYDEHLVMPKDAGILVQLMNIIIGGAKRRVDFLHIPVPKDRTDQAYFKPLTQFTGSTKVYFGLIHHDDEAGDLERIKVARDYVNDFGISTECGWGRADPKRVPALLASHKKAAETLLAPGSADVSPAGKRNASDPR